MGLLKLVIVDDEPILLEGLVKTYDWNGMGYEVVGFAQSGEQALKVIREKKPHVVLTDIRMKQISGLMVMEEIKKENPECQFVVLSAYRDFEYAKKACDLGAFGRTYVSAADTGGRACRTGKTSRGSSDTDLQSGALQYTNGCKTGL